MTLRGKPLGRGLAIRVELANGTRPQADPEFG